MTNGIGAQDLHIDKPLGRAVPNSVEQLLKVGAILAVIPDFEGI